VQLDRPAGDHAYVYMHMYMTDHISDTT
jgi:hypothetical protein